jgi:hypothetical protein
MSDLIFYETPIVTFATKYLCKSTDDLTVRGDAPDRGCSGSESRSDESWTDHTVLYLPFRRNVFGEAQGRSPISNSGRRKSGPSD